MTSPAVEDALHELDKATLSLAVSNAVATERERCAKIAESTYTNDIGQTGPRPTIQQAIAAAIRNKD